MKLDIVTVGPTHSAKAYVDRETGKPTATPPAVMFGNHRFFETDDHQLAHEIDGKVVAIVPPEGMADYASTWPDCKELAVQLGRKPAGSGSWVNPESGFEQQWPKARDPQNTDFE